MAPLITQWLHLIRHRTIALTVYIGLFDKGISDYQSIAITDYQANRLRLGLGVQYSLSAQCIIKCNPLQGSRTPTVV